MTKISKYIVHITIIKYFKKNEFMKVYCYTTLEPTSKSIKKFKQFNNDVIIFDSKYYLVKVKELSENFTKLSFKLQTRMVKSSRKV